MAAKKVAQEDKVSVFHALKKRALFALQVLVAVALLAWVVNPSKEPRLFPERIPVRFWHMWSGEWKDVVDKIVARFNASQSRYEVIALSVPSGSADQKLLMGVSGGDPPDVMAQWNQVIPAWAESGLLTPLDSLMTPNEWEELQATAYPVALKIGRYQGHLYGLTTGVNVFACYYRPDHLAAQGARTFPATLEELTELGSKLTRLDEKGQITRMGFMPMGFNIYAPIFGGGFFDRTRNALTLNTPENLRALTFLAESRGRYGYEQVVKFESSLNTGGFAIEWPFISGQYSVTVDGQWRVEQLAKYAPELKYATAPIPPPQGGRTLAGFANGNFMIIPKGAREARGAFEFVKFWSGVDQPERAAEFYTWGGWLPLSPKIAQTPVYKAYVKQYPQFQTFLDLLASENIQPTAPVPFQVLLTDRLTRTEEAAVRGTATPKAALLALEVDIQRELERRKRFGL
ncbi:MAG: ABC transporter substrate-binding protein [Polyangiaceae bacterium]|nr:ABC transporter substrate-binding protein [Polyangiaceae bacterium]